MKVFVCTFLLLTISSAFGSPLADPEIASIVEEDIVSVQNIHHHFYHLLDIGVLNLLFIY